MTQLHQIKNPLVSHHFSFHNLRSIWLLWNHWCWAIFIFFMIVNSIPWAYVTQPPWLYHFHLRWISAHLFIEPNPIPKVESFFSLPKFKSFFFHPWTYPTHLTIPFKNYSHLPRSSTYVKNFFFSKFFSFWLSLALIPQIKRTWPSPTIASNVQRRTKSCWNLKI